MTHDYYDPANLQQLQIVAPLLYNQLETILSQIHECWQILVSDPVQLNGDKILYLLDLIDLLDSFSEICKHLRVEYRTQTGRYFYKRIDNFNRQRTLLQIAMAMYDNLTSQ